MSSSFNAKMAFCARKVSMLLAVACFFSGAAVSLVDGAQSRAESTWSAARAVVPQWRIADSVSAIQQYFAPEGKVENLMPLHDTIRLVAENPGLLAVGSPIRDSLQWASKRFTEFADPDREGFSHFGDDHPSTAIKIGLLDNAPFVHALPRRRSHEVSKIWPQFWNVRPEMHAAARAVWALRDSLSSGSCPKCYFWDWPFGGSILLDHVFDGGVRVARMIPGPVRVPIGAVEITIKPGPDDYKTAVAAYNRALEEPTHGVAYEARAQHLLPSYYRTGPNPDPFVHSQAPGLNDPSRYKRVGIHYTVHEAMKSAEEDWAAWAAKLHGRRSQYGIRWEPALGNHQGRLTDRYQEDPNLYTIERVEVR